MSDTSIAKTSTFLDCLPQGHEGAEVFQKLASHSVVLEHAQHFNRRLLQGLIDHPAEPNAIDMQSERGDFVFEGLRPLLQSATEETRLTVDPCVGLVLLDEKLGIAQMNVPYTSEFGWMARRGLFNTNFLFDGEKFVVTPYRALDRDIFPKDVHGDDPAPAFELTDGEALAAEAGLVLQSASATGHNAIGTRNNSTPHAFNANVRDLVEMVDYARNLIARLDLFQERTCLKPAPVAPALPQ